MTSQTILRIRGIFVVDDEKVKGVITRQDLLKWVRYKLGAGVRSRRPAIRDIKRYVHSTTVKELIPKFRLHFTLYP